MLEKVNRFFCLIIVFASKNGNNNDNECYQPSEFKLSDYFEDIDSISPILDKPNITNGHQAKQTVRRWALIIVDVQNDFVENNEQKVLQKIFLKEKKSILRTKK